MIIALAIVVGAVAAFVAFLVGLVIVGTRREPAHAELSSQAPTHLAGIARRVLGVYVAKPDEARPTTATVPTATERR
jgi:hypothetical protein